MAGIIWDSEGILLLEFLKRGATINSAICADIEEVNSTNLRGLAKQEDESSPYPLYSPDLAPSEFHLSGPL